MTKRESRGLNVLLSGNSTKGRRPRREEWRDGYVPLQRHAEYQPPSKPEEIPGNIMLAYELHSPENTCHLDILPMLFHAHYKVPATDLIPKTLASFALQQFLSLALFLKLLISELSSIIPIYKWKWPSWSLIFLILGYCDTKNCLAVSEDNKTQAFSKLLPVLSIYVNVTPYLAAYAPRLHIPLSLSS